MRIPRSKRSRALILLALLVAAAGIVFMLRPREPSYKDKSLSYWLDHLPSVWVGTNGSFAMAMPRRYLTTAEVQADEAQMREMVRQAKEAVDAIGTNGLRTIVSRLRSRDSKAKLAFQRLAIRLGLMDPLGPSTEIRRGQALYALWRLNERARPIAPGLVALTKSDDAGIRAAASSALSKVAPEHERDGRLR